MTNPFALAPLVNQILGGQPSAFVIGTIASVTVRSGTNTKFGTITVLLDGATTPVPANMAVSFGIDIGDRVLCQRIDTQIYIFGRLSSQGIFNDSGIVLNSSDDLNNIVQPGHYDYASTSQPSNLPTPLVGSGGQLVVVSYSQAYAMQICIRAFTSTAFTPPNIYMRNLGAGTWGPWYNNSPAQNDYVLLTSAKNLNSDASIPGWYQWAGASQPVNFPGVSNSHGVMKTDTSDTTFIVQNAYVYTSAGTQQWTRTFLTSWSTWELISSGQQTALGTINLPASSVSIPSSTFTELINAAWVDGPVVGGMASSGTGHLTVPYSGNYLIITRSGFTSWTAAFASKTTEVVSFKNSATNTAGGYFVEVYSNTASSTYLKETVAVQALLTGDVIGVGLFQSTGVAQTNYTSYLHVVSLDN